MTGKNIITLTTDFGGESGYVGVMKGVILTINPHCQIIDITHHVSPQDLEEAAFSLHDSYSYFPDQSIHLVVVDPGVGSGRKPILVETDNYTFVGPDNGVFSFVYMDRGFKRVWEITNQRYFLPEISATFHGRDVFAPVAAYLSKGIPPSELGEELAEFVKLPGLAPEVSEGLMRGRVVHVDHFGNLVTNISKESFTKVVGDRPFEIVVGERVLRSLCPTYAGAKDGEIIALFGSSKRLEISAKNAHCRHALQLGKGAEITVLFRS